RVGGRRLAPARGCRGRRGGAAAAAVAAARCGARRGRPRFLSRQRASRRPAAGVRRADRPGERAGPAARDPHPGRRRGDVPDAGACAGSRRPALLLVPGQAGGGGGARLHALVRRERHVPEGGGARAGRRRGARRAAAGRDRQPVPRPGAAARAAEHAGQRRAHRRLPRGAAGRRSRRARGPDRAEPGPLVRPAVGTGALALAPPAGLGPRPWNVPAGRAADRGPAARAAGVAGVLLEAAGIGIVALGAGRARPRQLGLALGVAVTIAGYTLVDKQGLRYGSPVPYLEAVMVWPSLAYAAWSLSRDGRPALRAA